MLDEEMDHMIRDAAENHHPAYNDKAWEKMEKMLNRHLPQKRDGRRYVFFLLFFLLLGGGVLFSVYKPGSNRTPGKNMTAQKAIPAAPITESQAPPANEKSPAETPEILNPEPETITPPASLIPAPENPAAMADVNRLPETLKNKSNGLRPTGNKKIPGAAKARTTIRITGPANDAGNEPVLTRNRYAGAKNRANKNSGTKKNITITVASPEEEAGSPPASSKEQVVNPEIAAMPVKEDQKKEEIAQTTEPEKKKEEAVTKNNQAPGPEKKKQPKNPAGQFGITVSAGPDISFIDLKKPGKATLMYGAGLSYSFAKRITVRAGFYTSRKIYDAAPNQYHSAGGNYPYLYNIAAECKVYEIPVSISYHFGQRKNHDWFGSAGLSSFLMKSEYYDYEYKTPGGQYYHYAATIKDENKHYFSVLTLSGGYRYAAGKRIWLQAEPYIKLPLGGVGVGKVKLNSLGVLFTATIKPFAKK